LPAILRFLLTRPENCVSFHVFDRQLKRFRKYFSSVFGAINQYRTEFNARELKSIVLHYKVCNSRFINENKAVKVSVTETWKSFQPDRTENVKLLCRKTSTLPLKRRKQKPSNGDKLIMRESRIISFFVLRYFTEQID